MFSYTVRCSFTNVDVAAQWLDWLKSEHVADVLHCGAQSAEIFQMDTDLTWEIRYRFRSEDDFKEYELNHAPGLRREGLKKFPLEMGLEYSRSTGHSAGRFDQNEG